MKWHILNHTIVGIGAVLLFVAPFIGRTRSAPLHIRILLLLIGPIGVAWSAIGIYLLRYTNEQGGTLLSWPRFWALDHIKSNLAGLAVGILLSLFVNPEFYKRKAVGTTSV